MAQLKDKGKLFTDEVHLKKDDPNYGRPLEGNTYKRFPKPDQRQFFLLKMLVLMLI